MKNLESVMSLHQKGQLREAEAGYKLLFKKYASDVNLNYLYGKLLLDTKRAAHALPLLEFAYKKVQCNVPVLCEYAKCLLALHKYQSAYRCLAPHSKATVDTSKLFLLAINGLYGEIDLQNWLQKLRTPTNEIALTNYVAGLFDNRGNLTKAAELYEIVLKLDPKNTTAQHNLATVARRLDKPEFAIDLLQQAEANGLQSFQLYHNLGNAYSDLNILDKAVESYLKAIKLNPYYIDSYENLSSIYTETGLIRESITIFESAIHSGIKSDDMIIALSQKYLRMGQISAAGALLDSSPQLDRTSVAYLSCKARLYHLSGKHQDAFKLLKDQPSPTLQLNAAQYALQINEPSFVFAKMPLLAQSKDTAIMSKAYLSLAERLSSRNLHRTSYCDYSILTRSYNLPKTIAGTSSDEFIEMLKNYVSQLHNAKSAPLQQTVNGGTQTRGNILSSDNEYLQELRSFFEESVRQYISEVSAIDGLHEFVVLPSNKFKIVGAWSVFLSDNGYHTNHVHPEGKLSAVFYIDLPSTLNHEKYEGYLSFGTPNFELKTHLTHEYSVRPEIGKLVIFPSYFWHGTIPFQSDEKRLTIAFDISS